MASIVVAGDTSGTVTLTAPATAGTTTLTLPTANGTLITTGSTTGVNASAISTGTLATARLPTGSVLQVVQTVKSDTFSTSSNTFGDITGLSVSITPTSSSSKILISYTTSMGVLAITAYSGGVRLVRNSTAIYVGGSDGFRTQASSWIWNASSTYNLYTLSGSFLDSPATTSATTYKLQAASGYSGQTVYINRDPNNTNNDYTGVVPSQITVMEIAA